LNLIFAARGDEELVDVEVSGREPGFAESEVEVPGPAECLIEAELGYRWPVAVEAGPPQRQGGAVMVPERGAVEHAKAGVTGQGLLYPLDRRDEPAGEDVLVYPRAGGACLDHPIVPHGHRLQADPPLRCEQVLQGTEIGGPVLPADRLDHLHADDGVVAAVVSGEFAVVQQVDAHLAGYRRPRCPVARERGVLGHVGYGADEGAALGGPHREFAPAGADLQHAGPVAHACQIQ
jgi:hypothetical protein